MLAGRKKIFAIGKSPAVVLHAGEFHAAGPRILHDGEHLLELVNILPMDHEIQGEADAIALEPLEDAELLLVGLGAGDVVGGFFASALEAKLKMVEAGIHEEIQLDFVERKAGGDKADVEASGARVADKIDDVGACERFTAREIGLQDAGCGSFFENARPDFGGEFVRTGLQFERIRTVDAVKRAAMGELGYEGERLCNSGIHNLCASSV